VFVSPWRARAAVIAVVALFVIVISSVWRKQLEQAYEPWRIVHRLLSLIIVAFVLWHMVGVNYHMSVPAQRGVWIGMVALWVLTVAYVRIVKPIQMMQRPYHVTDVIEERGQSWTLVLEPDGHDGMDFMPGQFAWITIGEKPFHISEHPFSIASSAERPRNIEFTIRELGDFTSQIKYTEPGTEVYIDGPHSTFSIDRFEAPAYVFIAGGVGIVPIMSMLRTMADRGDDRPVLLMYGSLNWESIIYREELAELEGRMNLTVVHVLEKPAEEWEGESGYINADVLDRHMPGNRDAMQYFICGPIPMIEAVEKALGQLDVSMTRMHSELYEMA
jgi:3-phenylpropionate/trans-cinnamate dioxygenase ferredoxin reductase subunit